MQTLIESLAGHAQQPQHEHQTPAKPSADMSEKCKGMMGQHEKMMAEVKAADQRLDELVAKMNQASGQSRVDAVATVVTEMVAQRKTMRDRMMHMHHQMMGHMGEHMVVCGMQVDPGKAAGTRYWTRFAA